MRIANVGGRAVLVTADQTGIDVAESSEGRFGPSITSLYESWEDFIDWAATGPGGESVPFEAKQIQAPSPRPRQVFAIGLNYADHAGESNIEPPAEPAVFTKFPTSLSGPVTDVVIPEGGNVDWEVEMVVVVGREARNVSAEDAWSHIAGVTVGQDLSERRLQLVGQVPQFSLGKSYPGFSPTGPYLVTPDELEDPNDLAINCSINGEVVQKSRTSNLVFDVPTLMAKLSAVTTLLPGDVIFTGTPAGVGVARKPPRFLGAGDVLVSQIENVGELTQTFVAKES